MRARNTLDDRTYFGMRFFHGIESAVKGGTSDPQARAVFDEVTSTLRSRTLTRGWAARRLAGDADLGRGVATHHFDERAWEERGLGLDPRLMMGFADLVERAANAAGELAGVDPLTELFGAFQGFVRMDLAVRAAPEESATGDGEREGVSLGGEPDSANFFSFAEQAFWKFERDSRSPFWLELSRAAVAAQPMYLAVNFLKARRSPRRQIDYGPDDVLHSPRERRRRLERAPAPQRLEGASILDLARHAGENAWRGFLGGKPLG
ncbi:hypothetical protein [Planctomycetes bacterium Poly30]